MKIIICLDDDNGMMFNIRRQSRDEKVVKDIIEMTEGHSLWMNDYSAKIFADHINKLNISPSFLDNAEDSDFCFVENDDVKKHLASIDELIIYKWNRRYPADKVFDINLYENGFELHQTEEFGGKSHEKITKEIYIR